MVKEGLTPHLNTGNFESGMQSITTNTNNIRKLFWAYFTAPEPHEAMFTLNKGFLAMKLFFHTVNTNAVT